MTSPRPGDRSQRIKAGGESEAEGRKRRCAQRGHWGNHGAVSQWLISHHCVLEGRTL